MPGSSSIDVIPLWAFFPFTVLAVLAVLEIGYRLGRYRRTQAGEEKEAPVSAMSAAVLGLLAFFLTVTFSFSGSRFDERRHALIDEINAISTCFLRSRLLPAEHGDAVRTLLRDYTHIRSEVQAENLLEVIRRSEEIHDRLWAIAVRACEKDRSAVTALFVNSLNDVIDLHTKRVTFATRSRLPGVLWRSLGLVTVLSMAALGYLEGLSRSTRSPAAIAVVLSFSTVLTLIADLDRPAEGSLRLSPQMMIELDQQLREPADAPNSATPPTRSPD